MAGLESLHSRTFRFSLDLLKFYRNLIRTDVPKHLPNQMLRAGTSIGANTEEARSAYSRRDLASKYRIALREARECVYWLRLIQTDQAQLRNHVDPLIEEGSQLVAILTATVKKLITTS
jgi:four helix bundle protein